MQSLSRYDGSAGRLAAALAAATVLRGLLQIMGYCAQSTRAWRLVVPLCFAWQGTAWAEWSNTVESTSLDDGSTLVEYRAHAFASNDASVNVIVSYMPRFACSPLVFFGVPVNVTGEPLAAVSPSAPVVVAADNYQRVDLSVDSMPIEFPSLVDLEGGRAAVYFNGNQPRRLTMALHIADGLHMTLSAGHNLPLRFELKGSRKAMNLALESCQNHQIPAQAPSAAAASADNRQEER